MLLGLVLLSFLLPAEVQPEDETLGAEDFGFLRCPLLEMESATARFMVLSRRTGTSCRESSSIPEEMPPDPVAGEAWDGGDPEAPHGSFTGFFERHGSSDAWKESVWDGYLTQPAVLIPVGLAVSAVVISHWDRRLESHWQGLLGGRQGWSNIGVYSLIGLSATIGVLFPGEDRNSWDEGWTIGESFLVSYLTTSLLKASVSRLRPGHGTHSFPSGHSAMAFTGATLIEQNSGPVLGIPAYGLAAFTAFERVEAGRHFPSDVLAGAAIGTFAAGVFDALHWGGGLGKGGIAGHPVACEVDAQGLRSFSLQVSIRF